MNSWRFEAACRDDNPELWYPRSNSNGNGEEWDAPRWICQGCSVQTECLDDALTSERDLVHRYGMRAGLTPEQRRRLSVKRAKEAS